MNDFEIKKGVLKQYYGKETHVVIPASVTEIKDHVFSAIHHVDIQAPKGSVAWQFAEKRNVFEE